MITQLRDPEVTPRDAIDDAVFPGNPARPVPLERMSKRFGFTDAAIRIAHNVFNQLINALQNLWIGLLPVKIFRPGLWRENEIHISSFNFFRIRFPRSSESIDFKRRFALAGERSRYAVSCKDSYSESESMTTAWSRFRVIMTGA